MTKEELKERTKRFAIEIVKFNNLMLIKSNLDYSQIRAKARRVSSLHYHSLKAVVTEYPENNGLKPSNEIFMN